LGKRSGGGGSKKHKTFGFEGGGTLLVRRKCLGVRGENRVRGGENKPTKGAKRILLGPGEDPPSHDVAVGKSVRGGRTIHGTRKGHIKWALFVDSGGNRGPGGHKLVYIGGKTN